MLIFVILFLFPVASSALTCTNDNPTFTNCCNNTKHTIIELMTKCRNQSVGCSGQCSTCPSGKVYLGSDHSASDCKDCLAGTEPHGTTTCEPCRAHYFNDNSGTYCEACPTGWSQKDIGKTFCSSHIAICHAGFIGIGSACVECSPGTFSLGGSETVCSNCGIGKFQPSKGMKSCEDCEPGKYASEPRQYKCKNCNLGQYMVEGGQGACHDCIHGTYTNEAGQTQCLVCAMGKFAEDNDAGRQGDCKECPAGWFGLSTGLCDPCPEGRYQDESNQTTCKNCTVDSGGNSLQKPLSSPSSTNVSDCFDGAGLITYVFGMKYDAKEVQRETSECEIRPNMVLLCPSCSCNDNSRDGFWAGPTCNECRHGFAGGSTGKCLLKCPGYDGIHDSTMCSGNGKCWYGKYGNGQCFCGGKSTLDATSDNIVVDVKTCPAGQTCNGYGDDILSQTKYIPFYYLLEYRQYSVFVLKLNTYTPFRGHMWFGRFTPQTIYENVCSTCVTPYDSTAYTQIGYFNEFNETFNLFPAKSQVLNGFHGENCQHECATCVNYGKCLNTPHPDYYSYTLNSHGSEVFAEVTEVFVPQTQCICTSDIYDPDAMCCPHGFEPYVYYGKRQAPPYYQYTALPLITNLANKQLDYWTNKDLWLQNTYPNYAQLNDSTQLQVSNINNVYAGDRGTIDIDYASNGPYTKHTFYGTEKELCRACPGLFGKGVVSRATPIKTEEEAKDFWWDTSAKDEKCNGLGVCDFYRQEDEDNVIFMGEFQESTLGIYSARKFSDCTAATAVLSPVANIEECVRNSRTQSISAKYVIYSESYKIDVNADGAVFDVSGELDILNFKNDPSAVGYVTDVDASGVTHYYEFSMPSAGALPNPDANGNYVFHPKTEGECRYPTDSLPCVFLANSAYTVYKLNVTGQGDDRLPHATFDRFDTCFTYTDVDKSKYRIGNYVTETYANGQDPFLGGDCPIGHFCTKNLVHENVVGFKEACPIGYYQPSEGRTRTNSTVHCSSENSNTTAVFAACNKNFATVDPTDYVDKVCLRCPRHMYSGAGSRECTECPQGKFKKMSGVYGANTIILNMPVQITTHSPYYIPDETGDEVQDCTQTAAGFVHVPELNVYMDYNDTVFLPVLTCPYGYSSDPGTFIISGHEDIIDATIRSKVTGISAIKPPFVLYEKEVYEKEEYLPYGTLQKNLTKDYCFKCPGDSVSPHAGSMACANCFGNSVKTILPEMIEKVLQNDMSMVNKFFKSYNIETYDNGTCAACTSFDLNDACGACNRCNGNIGGTGGVDCPRRWKEIKNMRLVTVISVTYSVTTIRWPVDFSNSGWIPSGTYNGATIRWPVDNDDYFSLAKQNKPKDSTEFPGCSTTQFEKFEKLGDEFNSGWVEGCLNDCFTDQYCNMVTVQPVEVFCPVDAEQLLQGVNMVMKQGSCCKYTTFNPPVSNTKLAVHNKASTSYEVEVNWPQNVTNTQYYIPSFEEKFHGPTLGNSYKKVRTNEPGVTLSTADAIFICNYLFPDGWDLVGYNNNGQNGFQEVHCAVYKGFLIFKDVNTFKKEELDWNDNLPLCMGCVPGERTNPKLLFSTDNKLCNNCKAGTFTTTVADASGTSCKHCPAGQYSAEIGSTHCLKCPTSYYQSSNGSSGCQPCDMELGVGSTSCPHFPSRKSGWIPSGIYNGTDVRWPVNKTDYFSLLRDKQPKDSTDFPSCSTTQFEKFSKPGDEFNSSARWVVGCLTDCSTDQYCNMVTVQPVEVFSGYPIGIDEVVDMVMKQGSCCKYTTFITPASYTNLTVHYSGPIAWKKNSWNVEVRWPQDVTNTQYYHWL
jgi:hypothetical protein